MMCPERDTYNIAWEKRIGGTFPRAFPRAFPCLSQTFRHFLLVNPKLLIWRYAKTPL